MAFGAAAGTKHQFCMIWEVKMEGPLGAQGTPLAAFFSHWEVRVRVMGVENWLVDYKTRFWLLRGRKYVDFWEGKC